LGRRDSATASRAKPNKDLPEPDNLFDTIFLRFSNEGLNLTDLVALSGKLTSHTRKILTLLALEANVKPYKMVVSYVLTEKNFREPHHWILKMH